ncbi:hypothetical protein [Kineococcus aurantiacus]|uniref:DUF732 domain-containing protein n=1 Tax=Kineococcus aurantiacus TaxID=37633 RepID=A0A7Y9J1F2_9ACTN|nr:hypothetical protein [Kineococcus aurantiacus]NYD23004.1 hypothetical protein [Kineococcus aurantiacus]
MRRTSATLGIAAATLALLLGSCSKNANNSEDEPSATPAATDAPSTVTSQPGPTQGQPATDTESPATLTSSPDASQTAELATRLNAIAPGLGDDRDAVVTAASDLCEQVARGDDEAMLSSDAASYFGGDAVALTDEQSRAVVDAVRTTFCRE